MGKLCMIFNVASLYRQAIYQSIDHHWDCDWYFGNNDTDIKEMDISSLNNAQKLPCKKIISSPWYLLKGLTSILKNKDYSTYFIVGDPHCISAWYWAIRTRILNKNAKIYFWTHGWYGKESKSVSVLKKIFFNLADGLFLYGEYARKLMIEEGFKSDKLFVIHNSLNYKQHLLLRNSISPSKIYKNHFGNEDPTIIFIGRLTKVKHLDLLIEAIYRINSNGVNCNLVFVGDGSERKALESAVIETGISDRVWFYGESYDEKLNATMLYNADLCVAPGNVGLTAIHSMMFGTPVISHNDYKWQMPEFESIQPGITGDFFRRNNVDSLAETITHWLMTHSDRDLVREKCFKEIDSGWTPEFQMQVLKKNLKV